MVIRFGENVRAVASSRFQVETKMNREESAGNHRLLLKTCF